MANDLPTPRSKTQIIGEMVAAFLSRCGLKGLRVGSPVLSMIEAAAQSDLRSSADNFQLLEAISLDDAEDAALDNRGNSEDIPRIQESRASTYVTISDTSFTKVQTKIYQGSAAPIAGSTTINVASSAGLSIGDKIYIGRGTALYEGPIQISNITVLSNYTTLSLLTATTKFHNLGETVIKAQGGDRTIQSGAIVQTTRSALVDSVQFKLNYPVTIPDGETSVSGVNVVALKPGVYGNVSANSIVEFATSPFTGASVINDLPITNGIPRETNEDYRERIRNIRASRAKGTNLAIKLAALGVTAPDEAKRVLSAAMVSRPNKASILYIDDGSGYEEISSGVSLESITDVALGGEDTFKTAYRPVTKAYLETQNSAPFALTAGSTLAVDVGGVVTEHTFDADEFRNIASASAYEIVASINGNQFLNWGARTSNNGTTVIIYADDDENEDIQIQTPSGIDANAILVFPSNRAYSLLLYQNDRLLSKDGRLAVLSSKPFAEWGALSGTETLILSIDGTPSQTISITGQDFIDANTGYTTVGANSLTAWATVLTNKIAGATVAIAGSELSITSNKGRSAKASINITGGTLTAKNVLAVASVSGANNDYSLDRNTGDIITLNALSTNDRLTIGSLSTRAFLESQTLSTITVPLRGEMWFSVDGNASIIPTGIGPSVAVTVSTSLHKNGYRAKITATGCFKNVKTNDWCIIWDSAFGANGLYGRYRVAAVDVSGNWIEVATPQLNASRAAHRAAAVLANNIVLMTGGYTGVGTGKTISNSAETYNVSTNVVVSVAPMSASRAFHAAVTLNSNDVYVLGGFSNNVAIGTAEHFNGTAWTHPTTLPASATIARHTATLMADGNVFIAGGINAAGTYLNTTYIYNTTTFTYTSGPALTTARANHIAIKRNDGKILIAGGETTAGAQLASAEIYDPTGGTISTAGSMSVARHGSSAVLLATGDVLVAGGITTAFSTSGSGTPSAAVDLYNGTVWSTKASMTNGRGYATAQVVSGNSNKVTVLFGRHNGTKMGETYDPTGDTWADVSTPGSLLSAQSGSNSHIFAHSATSGAVMWAFGGADGSVSFKPNATIIKYTANTDTWSVPNPIDQTSISLLNSGLTIVRSTDQTKAIPIPSGSNYTASTLAGLFSALTGATASTYKTAVLRINTNTFNDSNGSIALITADTNTQGLAVPTGVVQNLTGHTASVESSNAFIGTPNFKYFTLRDIISSTSLAIQGDASVTYLPKYSYVAAKPFDEDSSATTCVGAPGDAAFIRSATSETLHDKVKLTLGSSFEASPRPYDRAWFASAYSLGAEDTLSLVVDGDATKKYSFNTWRKLVPLDTPYGSTNKFADADAANVSLTSTLGSSYGYADHALFMRARTQSHLQGDSTHFTTPPADQTRAILWRYYRFGAAGNNANLTYEYPTAANQSVSVSANINQYVGIAINLSSGAARTAPTITNNHNIGYIWQAGNLATVFYGLQTSSVTRTSGTVKVTIDSTFLTNTGANSIGAVNSLVGKTMYIKNSNVGYPDGAYTITANDATSISYVEGAGSLGPTAITGSVSYGPSAATLQGASIAVNDYVNFGATTGLPSQFTSKTSLISGYYNDLAYKGFIANGSSANSVITWVSLTDTSSITYFQNGGKTAAQIVTAVNALTPSVITGTLIGNGASTIIASSAAEGGSGFTFADGINFIDSATASGGQMQFTTKMTPNASLATNSDWLNEEIRMVPITAQNVTDYLNSLAVSGLSSVATVQRSSQAKKVQINSNTNGSDGSIQIQSGTANAAGASLIGTSTVTGSNLLIVNAETANVVGFVAGWVNIDNTNTMPKSLITGSTALTSITTGGVFTLSGTSVWSNAGSSSATTNNVVQIEQQGDFVCILDTGLATAMNASGVQEADWIRIALPATPTSAPQLSTANAGIFRIVRVDSTNNCVWIENASAVVQSSAECDIQFLSYDSMQIGDIVKISGNVWGSGNNGAWTVTSVGDAGSGVYTNQFTFKVGTSTTATATSGSVAALGGNSSYVIVNEGTPSRFIKEISYISPDTTTSGITNVTLATSAGSTKISSAAGSVMSMRDKLAFPYSIALGIDGYKHSTGLIGELNKVIEGDPSDPSTYPGYKAEGSRINLAGAPIRRLQFSILIRGTNSTVVKNKIRSAVASVVNSKKVGQSFAFSDVIAAVERIQGVVSATIISPAYDSSHDLVSVQPHERPFILDLENDISLSFLGDTSK